MVIVVLTSVFFAGADSIYRQYFSIPVTYYDFHHDGSNPDFAGLYKTGGEKMVAQKLLSGAIQSNPNLTDTYASAGKDVSRWYIPWSVGRYDTVNGAISDTAFKNIAIPDSIRFSEFMQCTINPSDTVEDSVFIEGEFAYVDQRIIYDSTCAITSGIFQYGSASVDNGYPLDGLGFGNEGATHNDAYSMRIHNRFIYHPTDSIFASCQENFWVFVNDTLVIDGGNRPGNYSFGRKLDSLGLVAGQEYNFDVFSAYCTGNGEFILDINFSFVNKRAGVDTLTVPVLRHSKYTRGNLSFGTNRIIALPAGSANVKISMFYPNGKVIASLSKKTSGERMLDLNRMLPKITGMVLVKVECLNQSNKALSMEIRRIALVK